MLLKNKRIHLITSLVLFLFMAASVSVAAQADQNEGLKKKYSAILGEYEFDLTEFGGDVLILEIHIDSGALWGDSGDEMPVTLEPYGDEPYQFTATDPEMGGLEFKFPKDEKGQYNICQIALLDAGLEISGIRVER